MRILVVGASLRAVISAAGARYTKYLSPLGDFNEVVFLVPLK